MCFVLTSVFLVPMTYKAHLPSASQSTGDKHDEVVQSAVTLFVAVL